jgi:hypothetical protein
MGNKYRNINALNMMGVAWKKHRKTLKMPLLLSSGAGGWKFESSRPDHKLREVSLLKLASLFCFSEKEP